MADWAAAIDNTASVASTSSGLDVSAIAGVEILLVDDDFRNVFALFYETMAAIRSIDRFKNLAIIAVTGKVVPGERQRCIDAGADDYVPKPVDTAELLAALRPWLPAPALGRQ